MKNLFVSLLIFIFVTCFFFIPHSAAIQPAKAEFSIMGICQDDSCLRIGVEQPIISMAQLLLINTFEKNLLCEATYANPNRPALMYANTNKPSGLAYGITGYKTTKPWRSFHAGK